MSDNLLRFKNTQKYLIFDFETCSLNLGSPNNKPWQLSFLITEGRKIKERFNYLIEWDDLDISDDARRITNFNESFYRKNAEDASKVLSQFEKYLYDESYMPVGHNILGFDLYIHGILRKLLKKKVDYSYVNRCIDTLSLAKAIKKNIKRDSKTDFISWQYKLNGFFEKRMGCSIQALCKKYEIEFDVNKLHDAMYDIELNFKIFNKQLWELDV
jgi:DNA polymerase III alpha subunit (gram-positive type)